MPVKSLHPCNRPGCPKLTRERFCPEHAKADRKAYDRERESTEARKWQRSPRWRKGSALHKARHPLCAECERHGRVTPVYVTDHIVPHRGDYDLFWDESNWQSLCNPCHEKKHGPDRFRRR